MKKSLLRMWMRLTISCASCILLFAIVTGSSAASTTFASAAPPHQTTNHIAAPAVTTCGGTCEGKDPYTYYNGVRCSDTAGSTPANAYGFYNGNDTIKLLTIQNWYSTGCQTNWAVAYLQGTTNGVSIAIYKVGFNTKQCEPTNCQSLYTGTGSPLWTNMTVAPTTKTCIDSNAYSIQEKVTYVISGVACA